MEKYILVFISYLSIVSSLVLEKQIPKHIDKECYGTSVGFGSSGSRQFHYENFRKRYEGCTVVHGNLEITNLDDPNINYELSFLSEIRYVSGYVLIGLVSELDTITLNRLEIIRGNTTYAVYGNSYSLVVSLTSRYNSPHVGLQELHLPALKEIVDGRVLFLKNPVLCYVNTIPWDRIVQNYSMSDNKVPVYFGENGFSSNCKSCPEECSFNGESRCWGPRANLCSSDMLNGCHPDCNNRCYTGVEAGCCHERCAMGCTGPLASDCHVCRDFQLKESGECVSYCPDTTYTDGQICIKGTWSG